MATNKKTSKKSSKKTTKKVVTKKKKVTNKSENNQLNKKTRGQNGGKRKGSGRKKGAATVKTREIADKLAETDEITPLEYMLGVLRETTDDLKKQYEAGDIDSAEYVLKLESMQKRKDNAAEKAAPYIHPRLSSVEAKVTDASHEKWLALLENE